MSSLVSARASLACVVLLAFAGDARAQSLTLAWSASPGCPDESAFLSRLSDAVGGDEALTRLSAGWTVAAAISRRAGRYRLSLRTVHDGESGERDVEGRSCEQAVDAAALVVALALDEAEALRQAEEERAAQEAAREAERVRTEAEAEAERAARAEAQAAEVEAAEAARAALRRAEQARREEAARVERERRPARELRLGLGAGLASGPMPALATSLRLRLDWERGPLHIGVIAGAIPRGAVELRAGEERARVRFALGTVGVRACGLGTLGPLRLGACAAVEGGVFRIRTESLDEGQSQSEPWFASRAVLVLSMALGRVVRLELDGGPGVALRTVSANVANVGRVHENARFDVRAHLSATFLLFAQ